jgi:FlaG/FlaF family flagellin (archaellin)
VALLVALIVALAASFGTLAPPSADESIRAHQDGQRVADALNAATVKWIVVAP